MAKRQKSPELSIEDFSHIPDNASPRLLLGIHYTPDDFRSDLGSTRSYRFDGRFNWERIGVTTGGAGRHTHYFVALNLPPSIVAVEGLRQLRKLYFDSGIGAFGATLDAVNEYRVRLKQYLGADCNRSYALLEEGLLPVDLESVRKLTATALPKDFDDLLLWSDGFERARNSRNRWTAAVVFSSAR